MALAELEKYRNANILADSNGRIKQILIGMLCDIY